MMNIVRMAKSGFLVSALFWASCGVEPPPSAQGADKGSDAPSEGLETSATDSIADDTIGNLEETPASQETAAPEAADTDAVTANTCHWVVKPYGQKINGSWYVVGGGGTCNSAMYTITLQQKRWWGWDDRDQKTILFGSGSGYPKAKCRDFGWYTWRTVAQRWMQDINHHWIHLGGPIISATWRTRC
jgi:hypothetical protein